MFKSTTAMHMKIMDGTALASWYYSNQLKVPTFKFIIYSLHEYWLSFYNGTPFENPITLERGL